MGRIGGIGGGNNSRVTVTAAGVRKVSRQAYTAGHAALIARQLEWYAAALAAEPFRLPALRQVAVVADPGGGYRVQHVTDWCPAPNLTALPDAALPGAVREVLGHLQRSVRSNAVCAAGRAARVPAGPGAWAR